MLIKVTNHSNNSVVINTEKILAIEPTRTSENWNCCNIHLEGGMMVRSSQSIDELERLIFGKETGKIKIPEELYDRIFAVQCIVSSACGNEEAHCAYKELDKILDRFEIEDKE